MSPRGVCGLLQLIGYLIYIFTMSVGLEPVIFPIYNWVMTTRKKGRGRPRKSSGTTKSESLLLRLDPGEKKGFGDAAELAGLPLSGWIRERLRLIAAKELESAGREIAFLSRPNGK